MRKASRHPSPTTSKHEFYCVHQHGRDRCFVSCQARGTHGSYQNGVDCRTEACCCKQASPPPYWQIVPNKHDQHSLNLQGRVWCSFVRGEASLLPSPTTKRSVQRCNPPQRSTFHYVDALLHAHGFWHASNWSQLCVHSLPINCPNQSSLQQAVLGKLQEILFPPNHHIYCMLPYEQHIEQVWNKTNVAVCDIYLQPRYESFTSARNPKRGHVG